LCVGLMVGDWLRIFQCFALSYEGSFLIIRDHA
jgi:hypothetical protein